MDQGIVVTTTSAGHYVRLALIFFASVLGLLVLGFVFGSSSASADDGGPDDGGLVPAAADFAGDVVETVAPVTATVVDAIPLADVPSSPATTTLATVTEVAPLAGKMLGAAPAGPLVGSLAKSVDATIETLTAAVAPVVQLLTSLLPATATAQVLAASTVPAVGAVISGAADGVWLGAKGPLGMGAIGASGPTVSNTVLPAAALGAGFLVLLFSRRLRLVNNALPVSPVYETDTSPD
jgi:hypothetical protein